MNLLDSITEIVDSLNTWSIQNFSPFWSTFVITLIQSLFLIFSLIVIDYLIQRLLNPIILVIVKRTKLNWDEVFYHNKVFRSLLHLIPISIAFNFINPIFSTNIDLRFIVEKSLYIILIYVFIQLIFRIVNSFIEISRDDNNYTTIGIRTFGQLIKVITIFMAVIILIAVLFNVEFGDIITVLGALTALILLVFRDTILGFVSGVQISTTKMAKVGDWINVSKYNVEGKILEINLTTVKIERFDKTIAMVPTYDLISSHITNFMPMLKTETRRIKRSIIFNIKSFYFCDDSELENLKQIPLLEDYIQEKQKEIEEYQNSDNHPKIERQFTNIGLYRIYVEKYLNANPNISSQDKVIVRQLDITSQGIPLEIYCFTNTSEFTEYEEIQANLFDHLLTKSKDFGLEVMQTISI